MILCYHVAPPGLMPLLRRLISTSAGCGYLSITFISATSSGGGEAGGDVTQQFTAQKSCYLYPYLYLNQHPAGQALPSH